MNHSDLQAIADQYRRDGFAIVRGFATEAEVATLKARARALATALDVPAHARFATGPDHTARDHYFLESASTIRGFYEPAAFDAQGQLRVPKERAINKIGHALHRDDEACRRWTLQPRVGRLARALGLERPAVVQSQFIFKPPHVGGRVDWHMDSTFLYTDPPTCTGLWLALDEATTDNGCLLAIPGSHRQPVPKRYVRDAADQLHFIALSENEPHWNEDQAVALCAQPGDLVLLHGQLVHASAPNASDRGRLAWVLHLIDLQARWAADNWMAQPPLMALPDA